MEQEKINELVAKYNEGLADPSEIKRLEELMEAGKVDLTDLKELSAFDRQLTAQVDPLPSLDLDARFHQMLAAEKRKQSRSFSIQLPAWPVLAARLSFAILLLAAGFFGGYWLRRPAIEDMKTLTSEVSELKEMMMLSLLEKESATDRLRAVSFTNDMDQVSETVTAALVRTMEQDPSVNVRLAALEALKPYARQAEVREELIRSIGRQDSPLVQVEMAAFMVSIQEKKSVQELKKLMDKDNTTKEVKSRLRKSIESLS